MLRIGITVLLVGIWIAACCMKGQGVQEEGKTQMMLEWWLWPFYPVGKLWIRIHRRQSAQNPSLIRQLKYLYPEVPEEKLYQEYRTRLAAQVFMGLLLSSIFLTAMGGTKQSAQMHTLPRPAYGEKDQTQTMLVSAEGEEAQIRVKVPQKEVDSRQAEENIESAIRQLEEYVQGMEQLQLPVKIGDVTIQYEDTDEVRIREDGSIRLIGEESGPFRITALLSCGPYHTSHDLDFTVPEAEEASFARQVQEALQGAELTEEALILPSVLGQKQLSWYLSEKESEGRSGILFAGLLPVILTLVRRLELRQQEKKKKRQMEQGYPVMIQKLTVYLGAGLSIQNAWERIAESGNRRDPLIMEMNAAKVQMSNGMPQQEALRQFGRRVQDPQLRRLANMLYRNLRRGDEFLLERLKEMNSEAWEEHKKRVRIQSEEAETKMLVPMILMLTVILMIILTPAMLTMNL